MKRSLFLICFIPLLLLLPACGETQVLFPDRTAEAVHCRFSLTVDEEPYRLEIKRAPVTVEADGTFSEFTDATLTVLEPSSLAGLTVCLLGNTTRLTADGMEIPVERSDLGGILRLLSCFSTPNAAVNQVHTVSQSPYQTAVGYDSIYGPFTVVYLDDFSIVSITFTYRGHSYCMTELAFLTE